MQVHNDLPLTPSVQGASGNSVTYWCSTHWRLTALDSPGYKSASGITTGTLSGASWCPEKQKVNDKSLLTRRDAFKLAGLSSFTLAATPAFADDIDDAVRNIKITDVSFIDLKFPGTVPLQWNAIKTSGGGSPKDRILELHTDQGIVGRSRPKGSRSIIAGEAFSRLKGQNLMQPEYLWDRMYRHNRKSIAKGMYIKAMGSLDLAIWDIIGQALNLPVHRILGTYRTKIPVYAAGGYYAEGKGIRELVAEMEGYVEQGFKVVKMKVGAESQRNDVERIAAVRKALGPDVGIAVDANNGYKAYEAIRFGRKIERYEPYWFEEVVMPDDFAGSAEVRQNLDIPIVAGENEYTRWGARDLINAGSADILNLDVIKAGGITEFRKIAALASAHHIPVAPHGTTAMSIHTMASMDNGLIMEVYPQARAVFDPTLPPYDVVDGYITAPELPGLGLQFDEELIRRYRTE